MNSNTKRKIIEATIQEFYKDGLNLQLDQILNSCDLQEAEFLLYFSDKEDLLVNSLEYVFDHIQVEKRAIINSDLPIIDKLKQVMIAMPEQYKAIDYKQFNTLKTEYPKVFEVLREQLSAHWEPIIELLNEGIINNKIKPISIPLFQSVFISSIEMLLTSDIMAENQMSYGYALEQLRTILIDGIAIHEESIENEIFLINDYY